MIFSGIQAFRSINTIKQGGTAELSINQIVNAIISLPEAKKNLTKEQYLQVLNLYKIHCSYRKKVLLNRREFNEIIAKIISFFDLIAPYEKYSGGYAYEDDMPYLLQKIRQERENNSN